MLTPVTPNPIATSTTIKSHGSESRTAPGHNTVDSQTVPQMSNHSTGVGLDAGTILANVNAEAATAGNRTVLQTLAFAVAAQLNLVRRQSETMEAFFLRIAAALDDMTPDERDAVELKAGLKLLKIKLPELSAALKQPESALAARLSAMAEAPQATPQKTAAATATTTYLQAAAGVSRAAETLAMVTQSRSNAESNGIFSSTTIPAQPERQPADARGLQAQLKSLFEPGVAETRVEIETKVEQPNVLILGGTDDVAEPIAQQNTLAGAAETEPEQAELPEHAPAMVQNHANDLPINRQSDARPAETRQSDNQAEAKQVEVRQADVEQPTEPRSTGVTQAEAEHPNRQAAATREPAIGQSEAKRSDVNPFNARQPDVKQPDIGQPEAKQFAAKQPEVTRIEARQAEAGHSDIRQPDIKQSEAKQFAAKQPEVTQIEARQPEAGHSDIRQPDIKQSEAKQSAARQLETTQIEARQPEARHSDLKWPEARYPEVKRADVGQQDLRQAVAQRAELKPTEPKLVLSGTAEAATAALPEAAAEPREERIEPKRLGLPIPQNNNNYATGASLLRSIARELVREKVEEKPAIVDKRGDGDHRMQTMLTLKGIAEVITAMPSKAAEFLMSPQLVADIKAKDMKSHPAPAALPVEAAIHSHEEASLDKADAAVRTAASRHASLPALPRDDEAEQTRIAAGRTGATGQQPFVNMAEPEKVSVAKAAAASLDPVPFAFAALQPAKEEFEAELLEEHGRHEDEGENAEEQEQEDAEARRERLARKATDDLLRPEPGADPAVKITRDSSQADRAYALYQRMAGF